MNAVNLDFNKKYTLLYEDRNIQNGEKLIVSNSISGFWLKMSVECYTIIKEMSLKQLSVNQLLELLHDDEDRKYIINLISKLIELQVLIESDHVAEMLCSTIEHVSFTITHRCNLHCKHCCMNSDTLHGSDSLNTTQVIECIDKIFQLSPKYLVLTGGEPLIRTDFLDILRYANKKFNGNVSIMSNATLINEENVAEIAHLTNNIDISIDGADDASCTLIRGSGVFNKVVSTIKLLQKYGQDKITLSMVLTPNNRLMTKTFDELCKELNVTRLFRAFDDSMGRAKENKLLLDTAFTNNESNKALLDNIPSTDKIKTCTCGAINNQISIEENGDLMPCDLLEDKIFSLGNLLNINNLKQFMLNHICNTSAYMIFRALLPNQFEKCKNCKVNYFCLSCMHEVYKMKNDPNYFTRYCNGRKQYLYKLIWDET